MKRREFLFRTFLTGLASVAGGSLLLTSRAEARTYMTPGEAAKLFWGTQKLTPVSLKLTREQKKLIRERSGISVLVLKCLYGKLKAEVGLFLMPLLVSMNSLIMQQLLSLTVRLKQLKYSSIVRIWGCRC